jgi:hypothetical protein
LVYFPKMSPVEVSKSLPESFSVGPLQTVVQESINGIKLYVEIKFASTEILIVFHPNFSFIEFYRCKESKDLPCQVTLRLNTIVFS